MSLTLLQSVDALLNMFRYRSANDRFTFSNVAPSFFWLWAIARRHDLHGPVADFALDGEFDARDRRLDLDGFGQLVQLLAEFLEILRVHGDLGAVLRFGNAQMLRIESDQIQLELGALFLAAILEHDVEMLALLLGAERDFVFIAGELEHLGEIGDGHSERHGPVGAIFFESHGAEGDVAGVHGLEADSGGGRVDVDVGDEVLDGFDDLFEDECFVEFGFEHG